MYVALARITLAIASSHSLKEKRMVVRRIRDRVRERVGVALNEVGELDRWQRAELGCAIASGERQQALELLDEVLRVARGAGEGDVVAIARDVWHFDAPAAPVAPVDERTGAGEKANAGGDDWVPDAWREDLDA